MYRLYSEVVRGHGDLKPPRNLQKCNFIVKKDFWPKNCKFLRAFFSAPIGTAGDIFIRNILFFIVKIYNFVKN